MVSTAHRLTIMTYRLRCAEEKRSNTDDLLQLPTFSLLLNVATTIVYWCFSVSHILVRKKKPAGEFHKVSDTVEFRWICNDRFIANFLENVTVKEL